MLKKTANLGGFIFALKFGVFILIWVISFGDVIFSRVSLLEFGYKHLMNMTSQNLKENNFYRTSDLALAAVLSLWLPIERVDRQNPAKVQFLFAESEQLKQLVNDYWNGQLQCEPKAFFNQLKNIKTRIYSE